MVQKRIRRYLRQVYLPNEVPEVPEGKEAEAIRRERQRLKAEMNQCLTLAKQLYLERRQGRLETEAFRKQNAKLTRRRENAQRELKRLPKELSIRLLRDEEKQKQLLRLRVLNGFLMLDQELRRALIREIIIHPDTPMGNGNIEIRWKF